MPRRSREFTPPFAAQRSRRSRELTPPFAALPSRRSREFTPPFADHPALSSQGMTPPSTANPSPPACLWLNARRPASDSMPAGLPLTQCPPACLWFQLARSAADSSSPDCRWLKLAGLPLTQARRIAADSCHWSSAGKANSPPLCFTPPSAAHQCFTCFFYAGKANPPSAVHSARSRLRLPPARRPLPLSGQASRLLPLLSSQPIMVSPAGRCRIDKPAGRGRIWPVSDHGLFNCLCVFSPGGLLVPLSCPMVIFWGGYKGPGCCGRAEGRGHGHHGPPALASWAPCSTLASVCLFHSGGPVLCMYPCLSWGVSRVPTPPPRWNCYGSGRAFREGGVMLEICRVCLVFPPLVSLYGSFHVIIG